MEGEEGGVIIVMVTCSSHLQKDTGSAMAKHSGAHLDLSAFTSSEVCGGVRACVQMLNCSLCTGADVTRSGPTQVWSNGLGTQVWRVRM